MIHFLKNIYYWHRVNRRLSNFLKQQETSKILLFGYPKSGNTWLRFLIYNYRFLLLNPDIKKTITYDTLNDLQNNVMDRGTTFLPKKGYPLIYRTHSIFSNSYNLFDKKIFIHRNPLDTLISSYYFYKNRDISFLDDPENIIGLLNVRALNIDIDNHERSKEIIFEKITKPWFIPETTNLLEQLVEFRKRKEHLAFVVDEFGELLGLITLEYIIEEIVGEIVDEIDIPENDFKLNRYGKVIVDGEINLRDLYKNFDLEAPDSESSTIAGYILEISKKIPLYGEVVRDNVFNYKILSHSRKQISRIEIYKIN